MTDKPKLKLNMVNEMIGIGMITATLIVILFAIGLFLYQQKNEDLGQIQQQGVSLVRLLGSMTTDQLVGDGNSAGLLRILKENQSNPYFAYVAVVNTSGMALDEVVAPGVIVAPMLIPGQPSHWLGEHEYRSNSGVQYKEFYAPIIEGGELAAFVRLGYHEPGYTLKSSQVRLLAILSMAIFMLTPIFYFLIKKEIKPLNGISSQLQALLKKTEPKDENVTPAGGSKDLMHQFSAVVETAYKHIDSLELKQTNSVVSSKLLMYQMARLESALNALPFAIIITDESGHVTYTSNRIHRLLATRKGEILGRNLPDICPNRELSEYLASCHAGQGVNAYKNTEDDIFIAETDKRLMINTYPLFSQKNENQVIGSVITFRDISNEGGDQKLSAEFIAHVAHELKTPLTVLHMYSETIVDNAVASPELTIDAANVIHDETERLAQMIDNLLNLAMIEMGTVAMRSQRVKLGEFLDDIYQTMSRVKQVESLDFKIDIPHDLGALQLDKNLMRVAINNLISNAIKYNKPGGKVELIAEETGNEVIIRVRDTGLGISTSDQQKIFNKFYRSEDSEVRKRAGHGLGLSLVSEIVKLHHGTLELISAPGEGSEFIMSFKNENIMRQETV
jgi:signal transduction histidine kinase